MSLVPTFLSSMFHTTPLLESICYFLLLHACCSHARGNVTTALSILCVCVCVCVCRWVCVYVCVQVYLWWCVQVDVCKWMFVCVFVFGLVLVYIYIFIPLTDKNLDYNQIQNKRFKEKSALHERSRINCYRAKILQRSRIMKNIKNLLHYRIAAIN